MDERRERLRVMLQKQTTRHIQKIRDSARGEDCTMLSPMCNGDPLTVVWCHSDHSDHGRGFGFKAHDIFGFYGCSGCNAWYDTYSKMKGTQYYASPENRRHCYQRAHDRSLVRLLEKGVLK